MRLVKFSPLREYGLRCFFILNRDVERKVYFHKIPYFFQNSFAASILRVLTISPFDASEKIFADKNRKILYFKQKLKSSTRYAALV